jgi:predicted nucleotidyltransferase
MVLDAGAAVIHTKRYLAAAGDDYYPCNDFEDVIGAFDSVEEAVAAAKALPVDIDWISVYDLLTGKQVASHYHEYTWENGHTWHERPLP